MLERPGTKEGVNSQGSLSEYFYQRVLGRGCRVPILFDFNKHIYSCTIPFNSFSLSRFQVLLVIGCFYHILCNFRDKQREQAAAAASEKRAKFAVAAAAAQLQSQGPDGEASSCGLTQEELIEGN